MKAHELAEITKQAVDKKNKERPTEIFNDLISKMKSRAEAGYDYIDFVFKDKDVVADVCVMLEDAGYKINTRTGLKDVTKISWAQAAAPKNCKFDIAWVGTCKQKAGPDGVCDEHRKIKCRCGKQAVRECDTTMGPFVCGFPTCGKCTHSHY